MFDWLYHFPYYYISNNRIDEYYPNLEDKDLTNEETPNQHRKYENDQIKITGVIRDNQLISSNMWMAYIYYKYFQYSSPDKQETTLQPGYINLKNMSTQWSNKD